MTNEVEKFDPSQLMEGVRNRIKATFVSLIPDGQWEQMCQAAINDFINPVKDRWGDIEGKSQFTNLCHDILRELSREKIIEELDKFTSKTYSSYGHVVNEQLAKLIANHAQEIFTGMFAQMFQSAVNATQQNRY